jgi:oligopeptide/dipeptide ABC transporter ATP-binding protein
MSAPTAPERGGTPLLRVHDLAVRYAAPRKGTHLGTGAALEGVTLEVRAGEVLGIVGETGSGKTTLARATVGLVAPAAGSIELEGRDLGALHGRALPEPLDVAGGLPPREKATRVDDALREVGLEPASVRSRKPRQLSGGQRQRVSLARAIVTRPALLFCDEPVSALDVSNRNLVLNLLDRLRRDLGIAVVIIAHDLSSLAGIADRVTVFYRSRLVEVGPTRDVLEDPAHPYTALLTASAPSVTRHHDLRPEDVRADDPARAGWAADGGCVFADRCRFAHDACRVQPASRPLADRPDRSTACHVAGAWAPVPGAR